PTFSLMVTAAASLRLVVSLAPSPEPVTAMPSSSPGAETTKWTRPVATDGPSFSPTAPSKAKSASTVAMKLTSPRDRGRLLQQPARATCLFFESASRSKSCLEHDLFRKPASTFRDHALILRNLLHDVVAHPTQAFDLRLHHVAGSQERVGALADAAAGATAEHVAALEGQHIRGVLDLLLGGEDELRGIAVLLDGAVDGEADGQIHMIRHEGARDQVRAHGGKVVVALAAEP